MTTNHFRALLVVTIVIYLGTRFDMPMANGAPPDAEDRIDKLEREVVALRRELTELRKIVANDRMWDRIRGPWRQHSHIRSGKTVLDGPHVDPIDGDIVWRLHPKAADQQTILPEPEIWILGSMTLDATKDPVWVDFTKKWREVVRVIPGILKVETERDETMDSIVRVERKRVHIALRRDASCTPNESGIYNERPASFESTEENGVSLFVLEPRKSPL